jgi:hypothetical protein
VRRFGSPFIILPSAHVPFPTDTWTTLTLSVSTQRAPRTMAATVDLLLSSLFGHIHTLHLLFSLSSFYTHLRRSLVTLTASSCMLPEVLFHVLVT